jgi:hypothetical protein
MLGGLSVIYGLGMLAGATVEEDPRSSDFGKLKFGNTRVDPMMGLSQNTVLSSRVASGESKSLSGKVKNIRGVVPYGGQTTFDVLSTFARSKLAPVPGTAVDIVTGKNVVGEKTTPASALANLAVPLSFRDIADIMQEQGIAKGTAIEMLSILGMGVQNFQPRTNRTALNKP